MRWAAEVLSAAGIPKAPIHAANDRRREMIRSPLRCRVQIEHENGVGVTLAARLLPSLA